MNIYAQAAGNRIALLWALALLPYVINWVFG